MSAQLDRVLQAAGEASPDGAKLLNDTRDFIRRFCAFPDEHCLNAVTLWAAHAHMIEHFDATPRLAILSPEIGSGKTRVLEILHLLAPESLLAVNASQAAIFRRLAKGPITLLLDEADAIWSKRGKEDRNEDLRAMLNAGYRRGASVPRCVGAQHDLMEFKVFAAVALAGIGDLPDTIMSRAVIVRMRKRAPHEAIEQFRPRMHEPPGHLLRDQLGKWADAVGPAAGAARPQLPDGVVDRPADVWEPLISVADAAGADWPAVARAACSKLCRVAADRRASLGVRLLADLRIVFGDAPALHTGTILERLRTGEGLDDDAPWSDLHGKPLDARKLASVLRPYEVRSAKVYADGRTLQGYRRDDLWDPWTRYLPPLTLTPAEAEGPEGPEGGSTNQRLGPSGKPSGHSGATSHPEAGHHRQLADSIGDLPDLPDLPDIRGWETGRTGLTAGKAGTTPDYRPVQSAANRLNGHGHSGEAASGNGHRLHAELVDCRHCRHFRPIFDEAGECAAGRGDVAPGIPRDCRQFQSAGAGDGARGNGYDAGELAPKVTR